MHIVVAPLVGVGKHRYGLDAVGEVVEVGLGQTGVEADEPRPHYELHA